MDKSAALALASQLRAEADLWFPDEPIRDLLLEAAEAIESLVRDP